MALEKIMKTGEAAKACKCSKITFIRLARRIGIEPFSARQQGPVKIFLWRLADVERIQKIGAV